MNAARIQYWRPFQPTRNEPWNIERAAHLHRRAGFGATWKQLHRDLQLEPTEVVSRVFAPNINDEFDGTCTALRNGLKSSLDPQRRLQAYWTFRLAFDPDPLTEKVTLFWHNHFATSNQKVGNPSMMLQQNESLRTHALGHFGELLQSMLHDPAMLIWLDGLNTSAVAPNENLGRELLELFTLGIGNYDEHDVRAAARCLTGQRLNDSNEQGVEPKIVFDQSRFDKGKKTLLGQTGNFGQDELVRILLEQPACARFLCNKIYRAFVSDTVTPEPQVIEELAEFMRTNNYSVRSVLELVFCSEHFFSKQVLLSKVASPVEWNIRIVRQLEIPPSQIRLSAIDELCWRMGQQLFYPPNVAGWPGGEKWIEGMRGVERILGARVWVWGDAELGLSPLSIRRWALRNEIPLDDMARSLEILLLQANRNHGQSRRVLDGPSEQAHLQNLLCNQQFQLT